MNKTKISQYIGILIIVAITAVSAFTAPSSTPNNNNVYPFIDSVALQEVKKGTGTEGGISVDKFLVQQAARFDGKVFIDKFISGPTVAAPDVYIGFGGTKSKLVAQGNVTAGMNLQADNLKSPSMERVCRDEAGYLVLCGSGAIIPTPDECPNIEGIQTTVQSDLFIKDAGGNCIKPGTTITTPPPPAPVVPTIEVRYINVSKENQFTFLNLNSGFLQNTKAYNFAPVYRINFGTATTAPITFNVGYCTNHGIGTKMTVCKGLPRSYESSVQVPDTIFDVNINGLISCWEGCINSLTDQFVNSREFGRNQITIPAGTTDTGWILHTNSTWTNDQKWNPQKYTPGLIVGPYYASWIRYRGDPSGGLIPDMTNVYFFNISDPSGVFDQSKLQNLSKPSYKLIWNRSRTY